MRTIRRGYRRILIIPQQPLPSVHFGYFILTVLLCPFFAKSFVYAFFFAAGTLITAFLWIPFKAFAPTFFSILLLNVRLPRLLHPKNALLPIPVSCVLFTMIFFNAVQPANAWLPIVFTFFLITALVTFRLFLNADAAIDVT